MYNSNGILLITFTELTNCELTGYGFAGKYAIDSGFNLIAIKSNADDWYKSLPRDVFDTIELVISKFVKPIDLRVTFGSSMGGYAAILFANNAKANIALAFSPQFDINQPWDSRWDSYAQRIGEIAVLCSETVRSTCQYYIVYDPIDLDSLHVCELAKIIPGDLLNTIKVPYAGHPVGHLIHATGLLKEFVWAVISGSELSECARKVRSRRLDFANYLFNLATHCRRLKKLRWAKSVITRAIDRSPLNPEFHILAALIAEDGDNLVEAMSHAALAVAMSPTHFHMIATLCRILERTGAHTQASHYTNVALSLCPGAQSS